ncbi:polysaccharide biosynthesis protein [Taibaiella soli]|uniref:Polysaccharide biosynthesis protein n=2 Tax=Taibaiella soli TaxID=1649169 RepID=A0A2W2ANT5_9BACT|nr:polysaccharide biosynthesis protein [Taibaiella soli]
MLVRLKFLPRWIIFLLDMACVAASLLLSYLLRFNFNVSALGNYQLLLVVNLVLVINAIVFGAFKSFSGVVRHTTLEDTGRFLLINLIVSVTYVGLDFTLSVLTDQTQIPASVILINFFIVNCCVIGYRLIVKQLFNSYSQSLKMDSSIKIKAAVYNTDEHGLLAKRVLNEYPKSNMEVVAFLDDEYRLSNKALEGIPIYTSTETGIKKLSNAGVELLVIASRNIAKEKLNYLVDTCLDYGIHVQQVPPIQQWIDGKLKPDQLKDIRIEDLLERDVIQIENARVKEEYSGKKILITGAAGSIGSELVRQLTRYNPSLLILCDKAETPMHDLGLELNERFKDVPVKSMMGDICDRMRMEQIFEVYHPDVVFHAAAYKHVPLMEDNPSLAVLNNILGTKNLVELSVAHNVEKFVMVSTDKAVNPTNIMGASKRIAEIYAQSYFHHVQQNHQDKSLGLYPTRFVTTRFGNVLGSNGSVIPRFKEQLSKGGPITVTHPEITRYFMTIPEACQLVIEAGTMGNGGEIFVFDMGKPVKIVDLARKMISLAGKEPDLDIKIAFTGLRPGEKLYEELLNNAENTVATYHEKIMIAKVREYDFVEISQKIERLINSARMHYTIDTVRYMKEIVPEFISNNSVYEKLDVRA